MIDQVPIFDNKNEEDNSQNNIRDLYTDDITSGLFPIHFQATANETKKIRLPKPTKSIIANSVGNGHSNGRYRGKKQSCIYRTSAGVNGYQDGYIVYNPTTNIKIISINTSFIILDIVHSGDPTQVLLYCFS